MGLCKYLVVILAVALAAVFCGLLEWRGELPKLEDAWWGKGPIKLDEKIYQYEVDVPVMTLKDLDRRLGAARIGEDLEDGDFHYGFQAHTLRDVIKYWKDTYDWRAHEKKLNAFPQYRTQIEGILVHFYSVPPTKEGGPVKPVLLVHGWPGSVWEFYKLIPLLTEQGFHVVAPSIPGYGFSEEPHKKGFDASSAAHVFHKLMNRLNMTEYYLQGGDWGSLITTVISQAYPQEVLGLHVNMIVSSMGPKSIVRHLAYAAFPSWFLSPEQLERGSPLANLFYIIFVEGGYFHEQATKPDTIGFGLNDSPTALAAYILEKFSSWTHIDNKDKADGGLTEKYSLDELLTNVMLYWLSGCAQSSMRLYKEDMASPRDLAYQSAPINAPAGLASFPHDLFVVPEQFAHDRYLNIVQYTTMPHGGHFAALEEPELLARDFVRFVEKVEERKERPSVDAGGEL